jgi:hypothetical protein
MRRSKSRLVAWLQCPKRLWLQLHHPELAAPSEASANRMAQGNRVGAVAQTLFGGHLVGHVDNLSRRAARGRALLAQPGDAVRGRAEGERHPVRADVWSASPVPAG